ncbi:FecR domain-containing protein [Marine Group I thaumarchaeote]|uniref:FecR domain-containing protein n=1 Tax=Marine Group I thaumarchaeote TaxID=2511932 RepID=A0A7K4MS17_9ARCH|nr:FecR domain-containing protein [Marine Group I thaumarchaeote]
MNKPMINRLLFLFICSSIVFSANVKVVAAISTLKGLVMVKPAGSRKYIPAYKGQMLKNGEWIKTKNGVFVAIIFLDGSNIKIQQQTEIQISSYRMTAKDLKINLEMSKGQAWSNVADQGAGGEFTITTPTAVASVKGTEFDLEYDIEKGETTLIVFAGEVEFAGELGKILAGAMTSSKDGGAVQKLTPDDLPSWQNKTDPGIAFKLKPDRLGKQQTGKIIKVGIQVLNAKSKAFKNSFSGTATVNSQSSELMVSTDGSSWSSSVDVSINGGRGVVQVKSSRQGKSKIIVNSENAESKIIGFEYYQTKAQKRASKGKLASIASKKGDAKLAQLIQDKVLLKSQVTMGSGNVSDVLQMLETGELELDGEPIYSYNGDGTVTVKLVVKPR